MSQVEARQIQCSSNSNVGQSHILCKVYHKYILSSTIMQKKKIPKPLYERSYHACYLVTSSIFSQEVTQTPLVVVPKKFIALHAEELRGIRLSSEWRYAILRRRKIQELKVIVSDSDHINQEHRNLFIVHVLPPDIMESS